MKKSHKSLSLSIEDDGVGFDSNQIDINGGLGLKNLENRVYLLKGNLVIESNPGGGTFINVDVPLD
jgi:signal transduction histidine kinase